MVRHAIDRGTVRLVNVYAAYWASQSSAILRLPLVVGLTTDGVVKYEDAGGTRS